MKKILTFVCFLMLTLALVGCGDITTITKTENANPTTTSSGGGSLLSVKDGELVYSGTRQVTLTYASWADKVLEQSMIDAFMKKYPNIKVVLDTTITGSGSAFTENLVAAAQANLLPDVFVIDNVPTVIDKGLVRDVNEYWNIDPDAAKVFDNISSTALYGDVRLAVPSYQFVKGIFVNKTLLDNLGIDIPSYDWTWDEFYEICKEVKNEGETPDGQTVFAINGYYGAINWEATMAPQDDTSIGYYAWTGTKFDFENASWIKYRTLSDVFYDTGLLEQLTPEEKEAIYGAPDAYPFGEGLVTFGIDGSWNAQSTIDSFTANNIDVEFYPFPSGTAGQFEPVILDFMCVSSQTLFPEEAYLLLRWMSFGHDGWSKRLDIMKESGDPLDRYPVADYEDIWTELIDYMDSTDYPGMAQTAKLVKNGIPDCDKWLPGYNTFFTYVAESSEDMGWYDMSVEQLAREWTTLINQYVDDEYKRLNLSK